MPTIPQQETIVQYVANSSQTAYTFAFYAPLPTDIQVFYQASNAPPIPASDILVYNVDYTVTFNADPTSGGTITLLFTPVSGYYLTINRMVAATITTNFAEARTITGENLDAAFDRLLLLCQQNLNYNLERNLSYIINTYLPDAQPFTQLPVLANQQIWMGSAGGVIAATLEQNPNVSTLRSELANNSPGTDGATLVGYYDTILNNPTTVDAELTLLNTSLTTLIGKAFTVIGERVLTGSGTYNPTAGTKFYWVRGVAGGAGGAGATSGSGTQGIGGGGSAGAYGEALVMGAASQPYTCGNGGTGGTAGNPGNNGTSSSFGTAGAILLLVNGVAGTAVNTTSGQAFVVAQLGGAVTTATFGVPGGNSTVGWLSASGGGISGAGGNSAFGQGGLPVGGNSTQNGNAGTGYGSGGSGALSIGVANQVGGAGQPGEFVIIEFG